MKLDCLPTAPVFQPLAKQPSHKKDPPKSFQSQRLEDSPPTHILLQILICLLLSLSHLAYRGHCGINSRAPGGIVGGQRHISLVIPMTSSAGHLYLPTAYFRGAMPVYSLLFLWKVGCSQS